MNTHLTAENDRFSFVFEKFITGTCTKISHHYLSDYLIKRVYLLLSIALYALNVNNNVIFKFSGNKSRKKNFELNKTST